MNIHIYIYTYTQIVISKVYISLHLTAYLFFISQLRQATASANVLPALQEAMQIHLSGINGALNWSHDVAIAQMAHDFSMVFSMIHHVFHRAKKGAICISSGFIIWPIWLCDVPGRSTQRAFLKITPF